MAIYSKSLSAISLVCAAMLVASDSVHHRSRLFRWPDHHHHNSDDHRGAHRSDSLISRREAHPELSREVDIQAFGTDEPYFADPSANFVPIVGRQSLGPHPPQVLGADAIWLNQIPIPPQVAPYVLGEPGAQMCPPGTLQILDITLCRTAAGYFAKGFDGSTSKHNRPGGCYVTGLTGLNLNVNYAGKADPKTRPVCQALQSFEAIGEVQDPTANATTAMPTTDAATTTAAATTMPVTTPPMPMDGGAGGCAGNGGYGGSGGCPCCPCGGCPCCHGGGNMPTTMMVIPTTAALTTTAELTTTTATTPPSGGAPAAPTFVEQSAHGEASDRTFFGMLMAK